MKKKIIFTVLTLVVCSIVSAKPTKKETNDNYTNGEKDVTFTFTSISYDLNIDLWVYTDFWFGNSPFAIRVDTANNIKPGETVEFTIDKSFYNKSYRSQAIFYDAKTGKKLIGGISYDIESLDGKHFEF